MRWRAMGSAMICALVPASAATAVENWTIHDLGGSRKESICVDAAIKAFEEFGNIYGLSRLAHGQWVVFAWGLSRDEHDAVITCTSAGGAGARGTLVIYSRAEQSVRIMARGIVENFLAANATLQKEYIDRALEENGL